MDTSQTDKNPKKPAARRHFHLSPPQTITLSFAAMILIGASLLTLPFASKSGESVGFLNALFTATSANCVTGLVVVNTLVHWTAFGKVVILALIQLGGLGFITVLTVTMMVFRRRISLRDRMVIQTSFNQENVGGMVKLIRKVIFVTFISEGIGSVLLFIAFFTSGTMTLWESIYKGVFHSVSAFCNAGFDIIGMDSLAPFRDNLLVNFTIMSLIVVGGLGFPVWVNIMNTAKKESEQKRSLRHRFARLAAHTKIVLLLTAVLILGGTGLFLLIEWSNPATLGTLPVHEKILAALFQSVTLRTAGFFTIPQGGLYDISKFISSILMIIGGSPAGTAGGIKTITLGIVVIAMLSVLRGRNRLEAFGRTLPLDLLQKALTVIATMLTIVLGATFILHFTEAASTFPHGFLDLLYEVSSASGTVGVTTGITPYLSVAGKITLILCMFLGRLGPITVVVALNMRLHANSDALTYPTERVIIG